MFKYTSDKDLFISLIVTNFPFLNAYKNELLSLETKGRYLLKSDQNPNFSLVNKKYK